MNTVKDKVVLVTGASSGIGEAIARRLAAAGAQVIAGARRIERLRQLQQSISIGGESLQIDSLDVSQRDSVETFVMRAQERFGRVDALVNNAGVMPLSPLNALKVDEWERMIDVNIKGVLYGIAAVLPIMEAQGRGHIINIGSTGSYRASPTAAVYCGTKYAVRAITDALRQENSALRVTLIAPGVTESELAESITDETARQAMIEWRKVAIPASAIADAVLYALSQPPAVNVSELIVQPTAGVH